MTFHSLINTMLEWRVLRETIFKFSPQSDDTIMDRTRVWRAFSVWKLIHDSIRLNRLCWGGQWQLEDIQVVSNSPHMVNVYLTWQTSWWWWWYDKLHLSHQLVKSFHSTYFFSLSSFFYFSNSLSPLCNSRHLHRLPYVQSSTHTIYTHDDDIICAACDRANRIEIVHRNTSMMTFFVSQFPPHSFAFK